MGRRPGPHGRFVPSQELDRRIEYYLRNSSLTIRQISKELNCDQKYVSEVNLNKGEIRKSRKTPPKEKVSKPGEKKFPKRKMAPRPITKGFLL